MADGLILGRTLVDLENKTLPVRVANLSSETLTIPAGTWIANCHAVDHVQPRSPVSADDVTNSLPAHLSDVYRRATEGLDNEQQHLVHGLLIEFQDVFAASSSEVGRTDITQHHIDTGDARAVKQPARRLPLSKQAEADAAVRDMLCSGAIESSSSPWCSPVVLVKKRDGSSRFCVDYRKLKSLSRKDSYPLPRIDTTLEAFFRVDLVLHVGP